MSHVGVAGIPVFHRKFYWEKNPAGIFNAGNVDFSLCLRQKCAIFPQTKAKINISEKKLLEDALGIDIRNFCFKTGKHTVPILKVTKQYYIQFGNKFEVYDNF